MAIADMAPASVVASSRNKARGKDGLQTLSCVLSVCLVTLIIGCIDLAKPSFWFDEAFSVDLARMRWGSFWHILVHKEANQSLYFLALHFWPFRSSGEFGARFLSVIFTVLTVPFIVSIGRRARSLLCGVVAGLTFSVLPFSIQATQEARGYSLLMLGTTVSTFCLLRLIDRDGKRWLVAYALSVGVLAYIHFFGLFLPVAHALWILCSTRSKLRRFSLAVISGIIVAAPMLVFFALHRSATQVAFLASPSWALARTDLIQLGTREAVGVIILILALGGMARGLIQPSQRQTTMLLSLWLVTAPVVSIVYSANVTRIYQLRYLAGETPALALLIALLLTSRALLSTGLKVCTLVVALLAIMPGHYGPLIHEDWRSADACLKARLSPGDQVLTSPWYLGPAVSVYSDGHYPEVAAFQAERAVANRVWVLSISPRPPLLPTGYSTKFTEGFEGDVRLTLIAHNALRQQMTPC